MVYFKCALLLGGWGGCPFNMKKEIKLTYLKKATKFIKKKLYNIDTNIYRVRKANIRIIIRLDDGEVIVEAIVTDIGFRGDIYK